METTKTTTDDRPSNLLRAAALLVERATAKLEGRHHICDGCGSKRFVNKAHGRVLERVGDLPGRLRASAEMLDDVADAVADEVPEDRDAAPTR